MARPVGPYTLRAREIIDEFPNSSSKQLARLLVERYRLLYKDVEAARAVIRSQRGALIGHDGKRRATRSASPFSVLLNEIPAGISLHDSSPYVLQNSRRTGIIGDLHAPYHSSPALYAALEFLHKAKITGLLIQRRLDRQSQPIICELNPLWKPFNEWSWGFGIVELTDNKGRFRVDLKHISPAGKVY